MQQLRCTVCDNHFLLVMPERVDDFLQSTCPKCNSTLILKPTLEIIGSLPAAGEKK